MKKIAIIGGGNIGLSLARGLVKSGKYQQQEIHITRKSDRGLQKISDEGFNAFKSNSEAIQHCELIVLSILPQQLNEVLDEIKSSLKLEQILISVVSGAEIQAIQARLGSTNKIVRAMPNTAIAINQSMTCIAGDLNSKSETNKVSELFDTVGKTVVIEEELMTSATALCACGIAFFLRSIRAASQGGVEIGFHAEDALKMAVQTALGAAQLLLNGAHPESEIDKVTSPRGCTIAGLNEMEHAGFSSALIKGIRTSSQKAGKLYNQAE